MNITDVRAQMPNYDAYKDWQRNGEILGIAVHHSATANYQTGAPTGDAFSFFNYHVNVRGWTHGGYNYVITGDGTIQYALDEKIAAYHAGFKDPNNELGLEYGQYWNNHYLAICLSGWFSNDRTYRDSYGNIHAIPNNYTRPTAAQWASLLELIPALMQKYAVPLENVRDHRELTGNQTSCPGLNLDPVTLRQKVGEVAPPPQPPQPPTPPIEPKLGEHVILLSDSGDTFSAALQYIWKFRPDISFAPETISGRWKYVTAVGNIGTDLLADFRLHGALIVDHIDGNPQRIKMTLGELVKQKQRFLSHELPVPPVTPPTPPAPVVRKYTVQPGDNLSKIALAFYGKSSLWTRIFNANRDVISNPRLLHPGQVLVIPPEK